MESQKLLSFSGNILAQSQKASRLSRNFVTFFENLSTSSSEVLTFLVNILAFLANGATKSRNPRTLADEDEKHQAKREVEKGCLQS